MSEENNGNENGIKRRNYLKGLTVGGAAIAGFGGLSMSSLAQNGDPIEASFCSEASTPPENPPGGQAGQCISCAREACGTEPIAVGLVTGLDGTCYTTSAEEIPDNADYITFKAGQNCFLAEVPENPEGDVTWCLPEGSQDISNATFYTCGGENPPTVDDVAASCDEIVITTSNIPDGDTLDVTVEFADGTTETYEDVEVQNGEATVSLPGDSNPVFVTVTYQDNLILFDEGVVADPPCEDEPAVTDVEVTCAQITIQTENIDEGETLDVTVTFTDDSTETYMPQVDANGVAVVELPGDRDPEQLLVEYDGMVLFDQFVAASDAPCRGQPECPPDLNIAFKYKYGTWWPDTYDDIGDEVDPDVFSVEGDQKEVTICAPFPFAVSYATRKKGHDGKKKHDGWDGWDKGDGKKHGKKDKKHHDDHKHHDDKSCGCFDDCKEQEPVLAESVDGQFCATISSNADCERKKKAKICWFRVYCPEENND
ncbi:hypothetical protein SAMN05421858_1612 [Haladaptatus litoreus]|uniref:Tat (Twin-arginine translocation) pathway signal sequence n=1 Tax=Haladaptatus litoreus TaxID=553468 RepID=A0A1N6YKH9_9EURY|nr:hypothetical protein [Haladaptatus litoreus]SIR15118.1 hypothetical protein SAMN05421858_1612 [Haladaptatus litoreus]